MIASLCLRVCCGGRSLAVTEWGEHVQRHVIEGRRRMEAAIIHCQLHHGTRSNQAHHGDRGHAGMGATCPSLPAAAGTAAAAAAAAAMHGLANAPRGPPPGLIRAEPVGQQHAVVQCSASCRMLRTTCPRTPIHGRLLPLSLFLLVHWNHAHPPGIWQLWRRRRWRAQGSVGRQQAVAQ